MNTARYMFQRLDGDAKPIPGHVVISRFAPRGGGRWIKLGQIDCCVSAVITPFAVGTAAEGGGETPAAPQAAPQAVTIQVQPYSTQSHSSTEVYDLIGLMVTDAGGEQVYTKALSARMGNIEIDLAVDGTLTMVVLAPTKIQNIDFMVEFFTASGAQASERFSFTYTP